VVRQRNAMLRVGGGVAALAPWNDVLVQSGARIIATRAQWVAAHTARFAELYAAIGGGAPARMSYESDVVVECPPGGVSEGTAAEAFAARLERVAQRELERGMSLAGPHRDELALLMETADGHVDLRQFGSGGQVRTGAIALRMIEAETVRRARGIQPLLLLDDVFAELDSGRSRRILELLGGAEHGQVLLTAPKESDVLLDALVEDSIVQPLPRWRIAAGHVVTQ
jgi:DNA replication and repair protein RecF